jgi:hypothetical protein
MSRSCLHRLAPTMTPSSRSASPLFKRAPDPADLKQVDPTQVRSRASISRAEISQALALALNDGYGSPVIFEYKRSVTKKGR